MKAIRFFLDAISFGLKWVAISATNLIILFLMYIMTIKMVKGLHEVVAYNPEPGVQAAAGIASLITVACMGCAYAYIFIKSFKGFKQSLKELSACG